MASIFKHLLNGNTSSKSSRRRSELPRPTDHVQKRLEQLAEAVIRGDNQPGQDDSVDTYDESEILARISKVPDVNSRRHSMPEAQIRAEGFVSLDTIQEVISIFALTLNCV